MTANTPTGIAQAIQSRRMEVQRVTDIGGGVWRCDWLIVQAQSGEAIANLNFAVTFTEKPIATSSFEMAPNQKLSPGSFPVVSSGVYNWHQNVRTDYGGLYYTGADLVLVASGLANLSVVHHVSFTGKAMHNVS